MMLLVWMLGCAPRVATPARPPVVNRTGSATTWHKAREQYMLGILMFEQGSCEAGAEAMRVARVFDSGNEWLRSESVSLLEACEVLQ